MLTDAERVPKSLRSRLGLEVVCRRASRLYRPGNFVLVVDDTGSDIVFAVIAGSSCPGKVADPGVGTRSSGRAGGAPYPIDPPGGLVEAGDVLADMLVGGMGCLN
jgi:hypothetical protein